MKATSLEQVIVFFDPRESLSNYRLEKWFIPREHSPRGLLKKLLSTTVTPQKILLIGHRGTGKSTELNKLAEEIEGKYHIINLNVAEITGRTNLAYEDLMLSLSTQVTKAAVEMGATPRPILKIAGEAWEKLHGWWQQLVAGLDFHPSGGDTEIGVKLGGLLGNIEATVRQSSQNRYLLKEQINRDMPELIRNLNWVIKQIREGIKLELLLVVEGLDKVDLESALEIFSENSPTITTPEATMIFTFPVMLRTSAEYNAIKLNFSKTLFLPNIATRHEDGSADPAGLETLRNLVLARMQEGLIEQDALNLLVEKNGGVPVSLVSLMRDSALYALERATDATRIIVSDAEKAIHDLQREIRTSLTTEELEVLASRHKDHTLTSDEIVQRLLYKGSLIDYSSGADYWCDAHPALWPLLK
jgi:Cdc6-like AAA superfamily ATPase